MTTHMIQSSQVLPGALVLFKVQFVLSRYGLAYLLWCLYSFQQSFGAGAMAQTANRQCNMHLGCCEPYT